MSPHLAEIVSFEKTIVAVERILKRLLPFPFILHYISIIWITSLMLQKMIDYFTRSICVIAKMALSPFIPRMQTFNMPLELQESVEVNLTDCAWNLYRLSYVSVLVETEAVFSLVNLPADIADKAMLAVTLHSMVPQSPLRSETLEANVALNLPAATVRHGSVAVKTPPLVKLFATNLATKRFSEIVVHPSLVICQLVFRFEARAALLAEDVSLSFLGRLFGLVMPLDVDSQSNPHMPIWTMRTLEFGIIRVIFEVVCSF